MSSKNPPEPSPRDIARACKDTLTPGDCDDIASLPLAQALGYAFTLLIEAGVSDPETYLAAHGILEL